MGHLFFDGPTSVPRPPPHRRPPTHARLPDRCTYCGIAPIGACIDKNSIMKLMLHGAFAVWFEAPGPRSGSGRVVMGVGGRGADSIYLSLHSSLSLTDLTFLTRSARCSHKNLRSTRQPMVPAPANLEPSIRCLTSCILCDLLEEGDPG